MDAVTELNGDSMRVGTLVEVETASGSYRGTLTQPLDRSTDVELRCAGHYLRVERRSIYRVRALGSTGPPR